MIDIMCDRLHLPAIIFTFPFYDHLHIILVCVQREGNSASIQSSQEPITLDFLRLLRLPRHAAVVVVELCCLVGWVGLVYARPRSTVHWSLLSRRCCCISPHNLSCVCVPGRSLLLQLWAPIIILCSTSSDRTWLYRCTAAAAVDDSLLLLLLHRTIIIITRDTPEEICCFRMDRSGFV